MRCAPAKKMKCGNCFTQAELVCILSSMQQIFGLTATKYTATQIMSLSHCELWQIIQGATKTLFNNNDGGWLEDDRLTTEIEKLCPNLYETIRFFSVRPKFTGNKQTKWLNNNDINIVMAQYELLIPSLYFGGVYSADIADIHCGNQNKCEAPQSEAFKQNKSWGMVLNTGSLSTFGIHWISVYQENANSPLEFFDSQSDGKITPSLMKTVKWLAGNNKIKISQKYHQDDTYNCGVFSAFFLLSRAIGITFEEFEDNKVTFEDIENFRDIIFE